MSWCRFGSRCTNTIVPEPINTTCPPETCPGSDVYVFESVGGFFECCGCILDKNPEGVGFFRTTDDDDAGRLEMFAHLLAHHRAGHHVRRSLLQRAAREILGITKEDIMGIVSFEWCCKMCAGTMKGENIDAGKLHRTCARCDKMTAPAELVAVAPGAAMDRRFNPATGKIEPTPPHVVNVGAPKADSST